MSTLQSHQTLVEALEEDREDIAVLAERDDYLGAWARVALAIIDNEQPDPQDCRDAGLESLIAFIDGEEKANG